MRLEFHDAVEDKSKRETAVPIIFWFSDTEFRAFCRTMADCYDAAEKPIQPKIMRAIRDILEQSMNASGHIATLDRSVEMPPIDKVSPATFRRILRGGT